MPPKAEKPKAEKSDGKENTGRRDFLLDIETRVQKEWAEQKVDEIDAPAPGSPEEKQEHYLVTFPYPYMNGVLHLGHAFSLTKAEFTARFQRLLGKRVLFPFGFHCTGMPIAACADKLKKEIAMYGNPPVLPEEDDIEAADAKKGKGKIAKKKSKFKLQWNIMREMGLEDSEIGEFANPDKWLSYFPPIAVKDLARFGCNIDMRRSFITTDRNPYYDAFIRWQFNTLKAKDRIAFGKRMSVYSPMTEQPCADHDRASGEGVGPQEYTLIKLELQAPFPAELKPFEGKKKVILPAATLRPETMYGQTNLFVLPEGEYGVFEVKDTSEVYVCSDRSALNMSYQDMLLHETKPPKSLTTVKGSSLLGCAVTSPLCTYKKVYILPLLTISMGKGTGVVTSVPSDAPDDYQALKDLKNMTPDALKKYNLTKEMVDFDVVPIIDIPELGTAAAARLCEEKKVKDQHDLKKLKEIKELVYLKGFYKGVLTVGPHKGQRVEVAKAKIRQELIDAGMAASYSEPESLVMSRSGDECVVALVDQWYLKYGEEPWKGQVANHVENTLECYNPATKKKFQETVEWLHEWACSRSYGLGTALPWDKQFVIESLSDSTIYMAYYTIAHFLQGGADNLNGHGPSPRNIKPEQLTDDVFNYVFLNKEYPKYPKNCGIPQQTLDELRHEFEYWYPVSLRVSGKDLIGNHLTMSIYNHSAIWDKDPSKWPQSFFTNGHLMINKEKMSKSTGNFLTLSQCVERYSADATRFGLADAGDGLMDANFDDSMVNATILRLTKEESWMADAVKNLDKYKQGAPTEFLDKVFDNEMDRCIASAQESYASIKFHEAIRACHYDFINIRNQYKDAVGEFGMNKALVLRYIEAFAIMLSPICPHFCQHVWKLLGKDGFVMHARWPAYKAFDPVCSRQARFLNELAHEINVYYTKVTTKKGKAAPAEVPDTIVIYVASTYPAAQHAILTAMREGFAKNGECPPPQEILSMLEERGLITSKREKKEFMAFTAKVAKSASENGMAAFETEVGFDELAFLQSNLDFVLRGVSIKNVTCVSNTDPNAPVYERKAYAEPGKPVMYWFAADGNGAPKDASAAPKTAAKAGASSSGASVPSGARGFHSSATVSGTQFAAYKRRADQVDDLIDQLTARLLSLEAQLKTRKTEAPPASAATGKAAKAPQGEAKPQEKQKQQKKQKAAAAAETSKQDKGKEQKSDESKKKKPPRVKIAKSDVYIEVRPDTEVEDFSWENIEKDIRAMRINGLLWAQAPFALIDFVFGLKKMLVVAQIVDNMVESTAPIVEAINKLKGVSDSEMVSIQTANDDWDPTNTLCMVAGSAGAAAGKKDKKDKSKGGDSKQSSKKKKEEGPRVVTDAMIKQSAQKIIVAAKEAEYYVAGVTECDGSGQTDISKENFLAVDKVVREKVPDCVIMYIGAGNTSVTALVSVPASKKTAIDARTFLNATMVPADEKESDASVAFGAYKCDAEKGDFAIKIKDQVNGMAFQYLRSNKLLVESDDDEEDYFLSDL